MEKEYAEYLMRRTHQDYNLVAKRFSSYRGVIWEEFKFLFNNYLKKGDKVLDIGCGNGRFCEIIQEAGADYTGIDISEKLIEIAKKKFPKGMFIVGDALNIPFPEKSFDKVYAIALLHHIPSKDFRLKVLNEAKRVLKKNGLLIASVWNLWRGKKTRDLISKFALLRNLGKSELDSGDILMTFEKMENCYFHAFTKEELESLISEADFEIIKSGEISRGSKAKIRPKLSNSNFFVVAKNDIKQYKNTI